MPEGRCERVRVISEEAAYWYIRYTNEPVMELSDRRDLVIWLQRSPENIAELLRIFGMEAGLARHKLFAKIESDESSVIELGISDTSQQRKHTATTQSLDEKRDKRMKVKKTPLWKVAAVAAAIGLGAIMLAIASRDPRVAGTISTVAGQRQHITLADGSVVHVGARSRLKVELSDERRIVHVYQGEAVFEVAKDSARPFTVLTPLVDLTAVGTRFGVAIDSGVTATVSEGVVRATVRHLSGKEFLLRAGEQVHVSDSEPTPPTFSTVDAATTLEWANGFLVFRGETIGKAAMEFNRHNVVQIEIDHAAIATRALPGLYRFAVDSPSEFARAVADQYGFTLIEDRSGAVLRLRLDERR